ncbi:hypothetical protein Tco_0798925 [Tanacetum coccineum]
MITPPSPNHVFNFSVDESHDFDDSNLDFEEDPQKEFEEDPQEDPEKEPKEEPNEEPKKASEMEVDDEANWDEEMNESDLIFFPYEEVGSPKPPPPESSDSETEMTAEGDHVQRVAREGTRVEYIKLKRERERNRDRERVEMVQAGSVGVRARDERRWDIWMVYTKMDEGGGGPHRPPRYECNLLAGCGTGLQLFMGSLSLPSQKTPGLLLEGLVEGPVEGLVEGPSSEPKGQSISTYERGKN